MKELEKRMYFFVPYNISPIQQAIQAGHAALEYAHRFKDDPEYIDFIKNWKTWIILNGGTTNGRMEVIEGKPEKIGTLNKIPDELDRHDIKYSTFEEPDLNDALTAVCFICDERVFDHEKYPDLGPAFDTIRNLEKEEKEWVKSIGGEKNVFLRQLLEDKKLA